MLAATLELITDKGGLIGRALLVDTNGAAVPACDRLSIRNTTPVYTENELPVVNRSHEWDVDGVWLPIAEG